jgi:formylglycine-generating enzyme required for sulfatase activity
MGGVPFYEPGEGGLDASRGLLNPVENVSWNYSNQTLLRLGLSLPTEAQWEYAARAGTSTPWWTGDVAASLADAENVADASARAAGTDWVETEDWDDGHHVHAPIAAFRPNPFGLHDVLGNVSEWCLDRWGSFELPTRPGDGYRLVEGVLACVLRGGCFDSPAIQAAVVERFSFTPDISNYCTGVRPARAVE